MLRVGDICCQIVYDLVIVRVVCLDLILLTFCRKILQGFDYVRFRDVNVGAGGCSIE